MNESLIFGACKMPSWRLHIPALVGILCIYALGQGAHAAVLSPDLPAAVTAAGPPGEVSVIINLADRANLSQINEHDKHRRRDKAVATLKDKATRTQGSLLSYLRGKGAQDVTSLWITNAIAARVSVAQLRELQSLPDIESIELDAIVSAPAVQTAPVAIPGWNISRINAPALWAAGIDGSGVVVANLDTGVDVTHPDLLPRWRGGSCTTLPDCVSWFNPYTALTQPYDLSGAGTGHGTGTMGVVAGGSALTAYGVAPGATWIAAKIFDDTGGGSFSYIAQALQWLLAPAGNAANAPDIVNNSWGINAPNQCLTIPLLPPLPSTLEIAIQNVQAAGIAMIFSAGNSGPGASTSISPANYQDVFAVGATDFLDTIAWFSSRGPSACVSRTTNFPNIVAPGVTDQSPVSGIYTSAPAGTYQTTYGTSFSAPHATGAMALLLSAFPLLTTAQLQAALEGTAVVLPAGGPSPNNDYGFGLLDVKAAYQSLFIAAHGNVPRIASIPSAWTFPDTGIGSASSAELFTLVNKGTASLLISPLPGGVTLTGVNSTDFIITGDACSGATLPSLGSCTVGVAFNPNTLGAKSAALTVLSNDPATPSLSVPLGGTCVLPFTVALVRGGATVGRYASVQTAYGQSVSGDSIKMKSGTFTESPVFSAGVSISLAGGYDATFSSQNGVSTIIGTVTVVTGTVTVANIIIQ